MNSTVAALRAISAVFLRRILRFVFIVVGLVLVLLYGTVTYFAIEYSLWALLILAILLPITLVVLVLSLLLWSVTSQIVPRQLTKQEGKQILEFTDKISGVIERGKTPYPIAAILIIKDVIRKRDSKFLQNLITDSKSLRGDFSAIKKLFP